MIPEVCLQSILRPLCMRSWSAGVYRLQFKKYIVGDGNLIGTVWFIGFILYLMLFMQSALCHLKRPSFLPISTTPVKLQDQGPQISCWLKCLIWLQYGSNSQNHPVQVHYLLESDTGKLMLPKHPTSCEVTENFFIRVSSSISYQLPAMSDKGLRALWHSQQSY